MTLEEKLIALIKDLEWIWEPYDDYYHKEQGYRCHYCGVYEGEEHDKGCGMGEVIAEIKEKEKANER